MKKSLQVISALMLILSVFSVSALSVEKVDKGSVIISELDNPAVFDFKITSDQKENIEIFTLLGISISPRGTFEIPTGTSTVKVQVFPPESVRRLSGPYVFEYQIKGENSGIFRDKMTITVVPLKNTLSFDPVTVTPGAKSVQVKIKNTQNTNLQNMQIRLTSEFFDKSETISLKPYEETTLSIPLNAEKMKTLSAGKYVMKARLGLEKAEAEVEGVVNYPEYTSVATENTGKGFIIRESTVIRTNEGNIPTEDRITVNRDVLTRLFTISSRDPEKVERHSLYVTYSWTRLLQPGESWSITTTTNYTFPFLLLIFIMACVFFVHRYSRTHVVVKKKVSYVKTKGGQFALKVQLAIKAKSPVNSIQIIDRLPGMTKMYEKFGTKPDKVDASTRRLFWNIDKLQAGEERIISYIVYSTMNIVGKFELPAALAVYEHNGITEEAMSNRAFFMSEMVKEID